MDRTTPTESASSCLDQRVHASHEKRLVALSSVVAAVFLTMMKLAVGLMTGSLGILAEAAHSALDLIAAGITFLAVRVSDRPADREHTYGHGKVENLSALFETLLLLGTCVWIIYEAVQRLLFGHHEIELSVWAFIVMGVSIVVDISRSRALSQAARKYHSQALEADALHFSTDVYSSLVVILGLVLVWAAEWLQLPWLQHADAVAAIGVAGIVMVVSWRLAQRAVESLVDGIPRGLHGQVMEAVSAVPGVLHVERMRLRRSGPETFADVTVQVGREAGFEAAHAIATATEEAVRSILPHSDVVVHVEPVRSAEEDLVTSVRLLAAQHGVGAHSIRQYALPTQETSTPRVGVELHLEVPDHLSVEKAHALVSDFEAALQRARPEVGHVVTHIEPVNEHATARLSQASAEEAARVLQALVEWQEQNQVRCWPHEVQVHHCDGELIVTLHCSISAETSMTDAHVIAEQAEQALRRQLPELGRIVIHVEPDSTQQGEVV
ncbi:MAG: cation-efflux pump, partial [Anaerolineae bacterium]|nr:cation-efflux pump [Anaerolineae bacterium]MDW8071955.1 cation diffusion facilitator family transporter [Anaerolineae bacterium]